MSTALNIEVPKAYWAGPAIMVATFLGLHLFGVYVLYFTSLSHSHADKAAFLQHLSISQGKSPSSHHGMAAGGEPMELITMPTRPEAAHMS